ncbi:MAG: hypothetical protein WA946_11355 [Nitrospirota bacterium]|jgi:hypothetical protein
MRERILGFIMFVIAVAALIGSLKLLNWTPDMLQQGLPSTYDSIDEVKSRLHIRDIYIPSYYPQGLQWPPVRITAQTRPYAMIQMEFNRKEDNSVSLVISQTALSHPAPKSMVEMIRTNERVNFPFKERNALLEVGLCRNNEQCCRISWNESPYRIEVIMVAPPSEVVKIAESMVYEQAP